MAKKKLVYRDFEEMIEKYNPFGFKEDGEIQCYLTYEDAYYAAMKKLKELFPRGYVDLPLYITMTTGLPLPDSEREFMRMRPIWGNEQVKLIDINEFSYGTQSDLESFIVSLHQITETKFCKSSFLEAYERFLYYVERLNREEELKRKKDEED